MEDFSTETTEIDFLTSTPSSPKEVLYPYMLLTYKIGDKLYVISTIALLCIGTLGNSLAFVILSRKGMRISTSSVYLRVLAVSDTVMLWAYMLELISRHFHPKVSAVWFCKVVYWLESACQQCSSFLVIAMTAERFFAVAFPLSVGRIFTKKVAIFISLGIAVALLIFHCPYLVFTNSYKGVLCYHDIYKYGKQIRIWTKIDTSVGMYIPAILILLLNILIIVQLRRAKSGQRKLQGAGQDKSDKAQDQTGQITRMLLTVSITYWFLIIPYAIFFAVNEYLFNFRDVHQYALAYMVQQIVIFLTLTNSSINFCLYCLSGNRFRQELKEMLCGKKRPSGHKAGNTTTMSSLVTSGTTNMASLSQVNINTDTKSQKM